ncbi:MAG: hypothetical protein A2031_08025 [Deltaproteobacteria bacterium RBG_19FT_COMBO_43_11]|nr:MAG: hypothetical protein A2031_08025 [Deltaproteobacteria bacterium RBG_19FT_COMBO_43_11]
MKEISLTQSKVALVDDDMFEELNKYKWYAHKRVSIFYAARCLPREGGKQRMISMHEMILGKQPDNYEIDHKDGNGLNNQRDNLRIVTHRQNGQNRHQIKASKYPGIYFHKPSRSWCGRISISGKRKCLGYFKTEKEAFQSYRNAVKNIGESVISGIF